VAPEGETPVRVLDHNDVTVVHVTHRGSPVAVRGQEKLRVPNLLAQMAPTSGPNGAQSERCL
jgi:hypothetical protein